MMIGRRMKSPEMVAGNAPDTKANEDGEGSARTTLAGKGYMLRSTK